MASSDDLWRQVSTSLRKWRKAYEERNERIREQEEAAQEVEKKVERSLNGIKKAIYNAAVRGNRVRIRYNGVTRDVDPLSFRRGRLGLLFFAYCHLNNDDGSPHGLESFSLVKIETLEDLPESKYVPQAPIDLSRDFLAYMG